MACNEEHDRILDRLEQRKRQLGSDDPRCSACDESDPRTLTGVAPSIVCYECAQTAQGLSRLESHHLAGRRNDDLTVTVPGNDHRILSELQAGWPEVTLRNPHSDPLIRAAAFIRGWCDALTLIVHRAIGWLPNYLERLSAVLGSSFGVTWWLVIERGEI